MVASKFGVTRDCMKPLAKWGKRARRPPQGLDELLGQHHVLRHQGHDVLGQQEVHVQGHAALGHQGHPGLVLTCLVLSGLVSGLVWS